MMQPHPPAPQGGADGYAPSSSRRDAPAPGFKERGQINPAINIRSGVCSPPQGPRRPTTYSPAKYLLTAAPIDLTLALAPATFSRTPRRRSQGVGVSGRYSVNYILSPLSPLLVLRCPSYAGMPPLCVLVKLPLRRCLPQTPPLHHAPSQQPSEPLRLPGR